MESSIIARASLTKATHALESLTRNEAIVNTVGACIDRLSECLSGGGKILVCGNGGSLCDATHFAEELTGRFRKDRPALAAIALADAGHITCAANDFGFEFIFSRGVEAYGRAGDVLVVLSTSGNSANILRALDAAAARGVSTIALLGKDGGKAKGLSTMEIIVPGEGSDRIQELHMLILHIFVEGIEKRLGYA